MRVLVRNSTSLNTPWLNRFSVDQVLLRYKLTLGSSGSVLLLNWLFYWNRFLKNAKKHKKMQLTTNSEYVLATELMLKFRSGLAQARGVPLGCTSFSLLQPLAGGWGGLAPPGVRAAAAYNAESVSLSWAHARVKSNARRRRESLVGSGKQPTLFAERGKRGTGDRQTVPPKAQRMVLLDVVLELLDVALNWQRRQGEVGAEDRSGRIHKSHTQAEFRHLSWFIWRSGAQEPALGGGSHDGAVQHVLLGLFALFQVLIG